MLADFEVSKSHMGGKQIRSLTSYTSFDEGLDDKSCVIVQKNFKGKWQVRYHKGLRITGEWKNLSSREEAVVLGTKVLNGESIESEFDYEGYFKALSR